MWFIFPQIAGLGTTEMSRLYAIRSRDEAARYLAHPLLGSRLVECAAAVLGHADRAAERIFGGIDEMKFRSSMTLFAAVAGEGQPIFAQAIAAFYGGEPDGNTLACSPSLGAQLAAQEFSDQSLQSHPGGSRAPGRQVANESARPPRSSSSHCVLGSRLPPG